ncbi:hypothetical protein BSLG_005811 [Batrachochytrium salamandrivorans]|nr:hypothetical protein BSLG_005811 [Batrachochytrium salamandrivorans]
MVFMFSISPVFLHISSNGMVRQISFWEALMEAGNYPDLDDEPDKVTFVDFIKKYNKSSARLEWTWTVEVYERVQRYESRRARYSNSRHWHKVRELPPQELDLSSNPSAVDTADAEEDCGFAIQHNLARILRIRKTSKSVVDKCEFLSFYRERESRRYKRKK